MEGIPSVAFVMVSNRGLLFLAKQGCLSPTWAQGGILVSSQGLLCWVGRSCQVAKVFARLGLSGEFAIGSCHVAENIEWNNKN